MWANLENSSVAKGLEKLFSFQSLRGNAKECSNNQTIALISHSSKVMLKILQARLHNMWTMNFQMFKLVLEMQRNQRSNCQHPLDHRKRREFQKNLYFCFIDYAKAFDCMDHNKLWKILNVMRIIDSPDMSLEKPVCRSGSNSQNWTWNNELVPNRKRSMSRLYIVTLLI